MLWFHPVQLNVIIYEDMKQKLASVRAKTKAAADRPTIPALESRDRKTWSSRTALAIYQVLGPAEFHSENKGKKLKVAASSEYSTRLGVAVGAGSRG